MRLQSLTLQVSEHSVAGGQPVVVFRDTFNGWTPNITYFLVSMGSQVTQALLPGPSGLPCLSKRPESETLGDRLQGVSYLS